MSKEKITKKKLIRIKAADGVLNGYKVKISSSSLHFALAGPNEERTKDGIKRRLQMSRFLTCREQLTEVPRTVLHKFENTSFIDAKNCTVDFDNYRLLMGINNQVNFADAKAKIFSGKRALNLLEIAAGWTPSVITTVKHEQYEDDSIWMLTGDARWMAAPQMISLSCLILRLAYKSGPLQVDSMKELQEQFTKFARINETRDHQYIGTVRNHIINLMSNMDKVFTGNIKDYYPPKDSKGWSGYGGIDTLIKCATGNDDLHTRLKQYVLDVK